MRNQRGNIQKLAGVAAMATMVTMAGGAVATAPAQADVGLVTHNIALDRGPTDRFFDHRFNDDRMHHRHRQMFREDGPLDRFFDHFFNDDRMRRHN